MHSRYLHRPDLKLEIGSESIPVPAIRLDSHLAPENTRSGLIMVFFGKTHLGQKCLILLIFIDLSESDPGSLKIIAIYLFFQPSTLQLKVLQMIMSQTNLLFLDLTLFLLLLRHSVVLDPFVDFVLSGAASTPTFYMPNFLPTFKNLLNCTSDSCSSRSFFLRISSRRLNASACPV